MDQPGSSSRNVVPQTAENPESPSSPDNIVENIPRVGAEISLGIGLESYSEDEHEEPSSEEAKNNGLVDNGPPVVQKEPDNYGYVDDYIGDSNIIYSPGRVSIKGLKGFRPQAP